MRFAGCGWAAVADAGLISENKMGDFPEIAHFN
jgi:hypothetical protein